MMKVARNLMILVDGSYYLYRAYHALPTLNNSFGEPTGAIYGVISIIRKLLLQYQPSHIAVVFDAKGKNFRNDLFKGYKSNRYPMPDKLRSQIVPLYKIIEASGILLLVIDNVEADDVIGSLALSAEHSGYNVLISTGDKDMTQLVSSKTKIISKISSNFIGPKEVQLKFGIPPKFITDYIALTGDSSDNIPGVPGIGSKTAQVLLKELGSLNNLYQNLEYVDKLNLHRRRTVVSRLEQYRDTAYLSYQLAKIKTDINLKLSFNQLRIKAPENKILTLLLKHYGFKSWLKL